MMPVMAACMAGAVYGDHCSPISDTTIMASAGAACDHLTHVTTQFPYATTVAAVSTLSYLISGFTSGPAIPLAVGLAILLLVLAYFKRQDNSYVVSEAANVSHTVLVEAE
jgi:Na+/H+ antiporter NhaC